MGWEEQSAREAKLLLGVDAIDDVEASLENFGNVMPPVRRRQGPPPASAFHSSSSVLDDTLLPGG